LKQTEDKIWGLADKEIADKFVGPHLSDFTKKTRQVNKK